MFFFYQEQLRAFEPRQGRGRLQERSKRKNEDDFPHKKQKDNEKTTIRTTIIRKTTKKMKYTKSILPLQQLS